MFDRVDNTLRNTGGMTYKIPVLQSPAELHFASVDEGTGLFTTFK